MLKQGHGVAFVCMIWMYIRSSSSAQSKSGIVILPGSYWLIFNNKHIKQAKQLNGPKDSYQMKFEEFLFFAIIKAAK